MGKSFYNPTINNGSMQVDLDNLQIIDINSLAQEIFLDSSNIYLTIGSNMASNVWFVQALKKLGDKQSKIIDYYSHNLDHVFKILLERITTDKNSYLLLTFSGLNKVNPTHHNSSLLLSNIKNIVFTLNEKFEILGCSTNHQDSISGTYQKGLNIFKYWKDSKIILPNDVSELSNYLEDENNYATFKNIFIHLLTNNNVYEWFTISLSPFSETLDSKKIITLTVSNIQQFISDQELLKYRRDFDQLTGIYNKQAFFEHTEIMLKSNPNEQYVFVRFDIERFKVINDLFGVDEGDRLLNFIGRELFKHLNGYATYGRLDDDVFGLCFRYSPNNIDRMLKDTKVCLVNYPLDFDIQPCFGLYVIEDNNMDIDIMSDRANMAARTIKGNYITRFAYYDKNLRDSLIKEHDIIKEMANALAEKQFTIYLQPKYDLITNKIIGGEALVRWIHPTKGIIPPSDFIPIFEKNNFIIKLDNYVWELTCQSLRKWLDEGHEIVPISVNMSQINLYNPNICDVFYQLIKKYQLDPKLLKIEVTESSYTINPSLLKNVIDKFHSYGFEVHMDDFGSGYSSLNMLTNLPVDELKIDLKFLTNYNESANDGGRGGNILSSIIRMAKWLNIRTTAEGIETKQQEDFLRSVGCDIGQGYYFAKPIPIPQFLELLNQRIQKVDLQKVDDFSHLNIDEFWNPNSQVTMLFNSFIGGIAIYEMHNNHIEAIRVNKGYYDLIGYDANTFNEKGRNVEVWIYPDDIEIMRGMFRKANEIKGIAEATYRRLKTDGSIMWLHTKLTYLTNSNGRVAFYGALNDITEQIRIENELYIQNQKYKILSEYTNSMGFDYEISTKHMSFFRFDKDMQRHDTYVDDYIDFVNTSNIIYVDDRPIIINLLNDIENNPQNGSINYRANYGSGYKWYRTMYACIRDKENKVVNITGRLINIDYHELSDLSQDQVYDSFSSILDVIPGGCFKAYCDDNLTLIFANSSFYELHGYTKEEFINNFNNSALANVPIDELKRIKNILKKNIKKKDPSLKIETKIINPSGKTIWVICDCVFSYSGDIPEITCIEQDITEQKINELQLRLSEESLNLAINQASLDVWELDVNTKTLTHLNQDNNKFSTNKIVEDMPNSIIKSGIVHNDSINDIENIYQNIYDGKSNGSAVIKILNKSNDYIWIKMSYIAVKDENSTTNKIIGIYDDITENKINELRLKQERLYRETLTKDAITTFEFDLTDNSITQPDDVLLLLLSLTKEDSYDRFVDSFITKLVYPDHQNHMNYLLSKDDLLRRLATGQQSSSAEFQLFLIGENRYTWSKVNVHLITNPDNGHIYCSFYVKDINNRKLKEIQMMNQASCDSLTGVLNRISVENRVDSILETNKNLGAFLFVDVDNFKLLNDTFGHEFGDRILILLSDKMRGVFKKNAIIGRLGGDEFCVFVPDIVSKDFLIESVDYFCKHFSRKIEQNGRTASVSCSVGIAFYPENGATFKTLFKHADEAQYCVKRSGKNKFEIYKKMIKK